MYCVPWFVPSGAAILPVRNFHLNFVFAGTEVFLTIFVDLGRVIALIILGSPFAWCGEGGGGGWYGGGGIRAGDIAVAFADVVYWDTMSC